MHHKEAVFGALVIHNQTPEQKERERQAAINYELSMTSFLLFFFLNSFFPFSFSLFLFLFLTITSE